MNIEKIIDPRKNFFIEASAGTGKTYTIQQIVAQLIDEGCPLQKILIVTYTEKAAGELKDRIRKKMEEVLDNSTDAVTTEKFDKALREVDNASIFTIHSFCQKALKEYAYDAGRPFDLTMIDDKDVQTIVHLWARDKWPKDPLFQKILKNSGAIDSLEASLCNLLVAAINLYKGTDKSEAVNAKISANSAHSNSGNINPKELVVLDNISSNDILEEPKCFEDLSVFEGFTENLGTLEKNANLCFSKNKTIADFIEVLKEWTAGSPLFDGKQFKATPTTKTWPLAAQNAFGYFGALKKSITDLPGIIETNQKHQFLYSQIRPLFDEWQKFKREIKAQSFNDMILSVHNAVLSENGNGEESGLCQKLRSQYSFAIIDEFQDTNQLQWDIFKKLFLNVKDHSIFVVGDPKQSIYSFQGADVNVYHNATAEICNRKDLEHNYRSTNSIIEACNRLFASPSFFGDSVDFKKSYAPGEKPTDSPESKKAQKPGALMFNAKSQKWEECKAFWISENKIDEEIFAQTCVEKIIECCSFIDTPDGPRTRLQVFNKNAGKCEGRAGETHRNVTFKDFAILARTRTEMETIEESMKNAGVPYTRYKDDKLFYGRECAEWISLFKAINAVDFSSWNRRILNEVLITDFFAIRLSDVESEYFDDPMSEQRQMINRWKALAGKRRFAEMQECIYSESNIEKRLMDLSRLQNLTKLRQIGNYAINYLYNHSCTLGDLIRHLQGLANASGDVDDQDGNLVAKGSDFDAVQVMTIHASKGLEFPIVISVAGFKQMNKSASGPFLYHSGNDVRLGFGTNAKKARQKEELEEWSRLFYVNFTRPSSILILPRYSNWYDEKFDNVKEDFKFLAYSMNDFCVSENEDLYCVIESVKEWNPSWEKSLKQKVQNFILTPAQNLLEQTQYSDDETEESQKEKIAQLQKDTRKLSITQHSYSTLAGKVDSNVGIDDENFNKEGHSEGGSYVENNSDETEFTGVSVSQSEITRREAEIHYPRGSKLGNALHSIFELVKFHEFGLNHPTEDSIYGSTELSTLVEDMFKKQSLPIWNHQEDWTNHTLHILWNTLNASLPGIEAGSAPGTDFKLTSIAPYHSKAEAQFNLNATTENNGEASAFLQSICKGFIDLMFMRKDSEGNIRYSILDWKSDVMPDGDYRAENIRKRVDEDYSVQRVLYSYCLIKWLKQFYGGSASINNACIEGAEINLDKSAGINNAGIEGAPEQLLESEIFDKYFGGIYYVFVRGCKAGTSDGVYAHTWKNYEELQKSYDNVRKLMYKQKEKLEEK